MYLHPWDVVDEGVDTVLGRITSTGIRSVNLATSYHSGRYLLQHNPKRKVYFAEDGVVYFEPDLSYYRGGALKPIRSTRYRDVDVLALVLRNAKRFGVKVNSWTVTLHNSAMARRHPKLAVIDAFGGVNYNHLCPNNPEVRKYHSALVRNLLDYDLNAIQLESSAFPGALLHGDHHETFGSPIEPVVSELMTFCFCEHCLKRGKVEGLELAEARKVVRSVVETGLSLPASVLAGTPSYETQRTANVLFSGIGTLRDIQCFQKDAVTGIFSEARETIRDQGSKTNLRVVSVGGLSDHLVGRGSGGISLERLRAVVDGVDMIVYVSEPMLAHYIVRWSAFEAEKCPIFAALRPAYPVILTREATIASVGAVLDAGAAGVAFYNYGWTPLRHFEWIKESLELAS